MAFSKLPWNWITANLPNTGKYAWRLPPTLPAKVFFKMMIRDEAGNVPVSGEVLNFSV
jgi:hypothetical protein